MTWRSSELLGLTHIDQDDGIARRQATLELRVIDPLGCAGALSVEQTGQEARHVDYSAAERTIARNAGRGTTARCTAIERVLVASPASADEFNATADCQPWTSRRRSRTPSPVTCSETESDSMCAQNIYDDPAFFAGYAQ